ncbi:MAG: ribonuclease E/G, partial [Cryobacterium sp.]|nr:ribonuclease E/G [Cryobacterium sp.]
MVETNDNKKKSRIFGGRRTKSSTTESGSDGVPAVSETTPTKAKTGTASPKTRAAKSTEQSEPAAKSPAGTTRTVKAPPKSAAKAASEKSLSAAGSERNPEGSAKRSGAAAAGSPPVASSGLSPLFQAPDLPPMTARQGQRSGDEQESSSTVRRRTRRRSGEEGDVDSAQPNTVVKVRQPRQQPAPSNEPQRVKGSTRLEAKKQRRRDGRDAGRRRPVITEAEFLARRESVDRAMVVRSKDDRIQIGVLEDDVLVEHYVAKSQEASLIGNVYLGRVQNVLPSMEAAFVDIGRGRNAVLYSGEVDWDAAAENSAEGKPQARRIELALKPGDKVLVQVTKDPVGHKGARLTSQVSLPGRFLVYVPNGSMNGISRKLPDTERARLKKILKEVLPENVGVIVRTAAEGATEEQLTLDVNRLTQQWAQISTAVEKTQAPALLHSEPDLLV